MHEFRAWFQIATQYFKNKLNPVYHVYYCGYLETADPTLVLTGGFSLKHCTLLQCWFNVGPASQTLT